MLDASDRGGADWSVDALDHMYDEAVCAGGALSPWSAGEERLHNPLELLARITVHTPHLTLVLVQLASAGEMAPECLASQARRYAALAIRLAHRALEVHARDVDYDLDVWRQRAVLEASAALCSVDLGRPDGLDFAATTVALASGELAAGIVAMHTDRMAVPGHLASAIGGWLCGYFGAERVQAKRAEATD